MTSAAEFFAATARPTADEFLSDTGNIRRGRLASIVLYHVADYWDQENSPSQKSLSRLHQSLIKICPDFAIVRDVADASKHAQLKQSNQSQVPRGLLSSDQVASSPGLLEAPFGVEGFAEASEIVVTLNGGTTRPLVTAVRAVLSMWEAKFR